MNLNSIAGELPVARYFAVSSGKRVRMDAPMLESKPFLSPLLSGSALSSLVLAVPRALQASCF
jgi:hypothetical protein